MEHIYISQLLKMLVEIGEPGRKRVFDALMIEMFGDSISDTMPDGSPDLTHERYFDALQRTISYVLISGASLPSNFENNALGH